MTSAIANQSKILAAWRSKSPGLAEFNTILNLLDDPVLLYDRRRNQILAANSQFFQLTAFSLSDTIGASLERLMPNIDSQALLDYKRHEALVNRRQRDPMAVIFHAIPLENTSQTIVILITPLDIFRQNQSKLEWQEKLLKSLQELANLTVQPDLDSCLKLAVQLGQQLLNCGVIAIYKAESQFPQLNRIAASEIVDTLDFPTTLASMDLIRLEQPTVWHGGKRVLSEIQRAARVANMSYLATIPLGQPGAWFGLLAAGDPSAGPLEDVLPLLEILGANLTSAIQHFVLVDNALTTHQKTEKELAIQHHISANGEEGVIVLSPDLTIIEMNPAAEDILGYATQEVLAKTIDAILIGTEALGPALKSAVQGIPTYNLGNVKLHRRNGQFFPAAIKTVPVLDGSDVASILVFLRDVSENEQIRAHTQQLEQRALLGEVTAIFAHEVRNPINNISLGLQLMAINSAENEQTRDLISRMQTDCNRLTHLMESVLTFSKPTEYKMEPVNLTTQINHILERWRPRFTRANCQFIFNPSIEAPTVLGDMRALEQVFTNLMTNSITAMTRNGGGVFAIKISVVNEVPEQPQIEIAMSDNGPGIPEDIRDRIFEPFVTSSSQGTGLGLAITKRILTAHRGSINVNSFPGGTVFYIRLPAISGETS